MTDAKTQIIEAIDAAPRITAAGRQSLLAVAARALEPGVRLSKSGIASALGLHTSQVVAALVAADIAGDSNSRREMGRELFGALTLRTHAPELTAEGRLGLAVWCLEQLRPLEDQLAGLLGRCLQLANVALGGGEPSQGALAELQDRALKLQTNKVVPVRAGHKEKLGLTPQARVQRRGSQAIWAMVQGLRERGASDNLCTTVAGETTWALGLSGGLDAARGFCLALGDYLEQLPEQRLTPRPSNGG